MAASMMHCRCPLMGMFTKRLILKQLSRNLNLRCRGRPVRPAGHARQTSSFSGLGQRHLAVSLLRHKIPSQIAEARSSTKVTPSHPYCTVTSNDKPVKSLVDDALGNRTPSSLTAEELSLVFNNLQAGFYESLSHLPWLQNNRHIAFIQLLLADKLKAFPKPIWEHPKMGELAGCLTKECHNMSSLQLVQTLLSLMHLGAMHSPYIDSTLSPLLLLCRERVDTFDLESLDIMIGIRCRMFQRDWISMQLELNRFAQLLEDPTMDWTPTTAAHLGNIILNVLSLPLADTELHAVRPMEKLLSLLQDPSYLEDADTICMYLRLARRTFLRPNMDQAQPRELISLASTACLKHMHKFDPHNVAEGCAALRQSRCFRPDLMEAFRARGLELLTSDSKLADASNLFYSINQHTSIDIKRRYESAIFQKLNGEVDSVILSNLAENFATVNVKNSDLLLAFQEHVAKQADKLAHYATRFNKIVRLLIRKPFIDPEHAATFNKSVLAELDKEFKMSNLALFTLYLLPSTTTALDDAFMDRILTGIPKLRSYDHHRIALGINQMRLPMTSKLRKQIAVIQSALYDQIIRKSEEISSLDYLYQITMETVIHNKKRDPTLTTHFMEMFPRFTKNITDVGLIKVLQVFHEMAYCLPEVYDDLVEFTINNFDTIQQERLVFVLVSLAKVGYIPKRFDEFVPLMLKVYHKLSETGDFRNQLLLMRSLSILQVYPEQELLEIFSIDYIERLDQAMDNNPLQKAKLEQVMMGLNRNVLLECPQLDVPWFHQQYLEDHLLSEEPERPTLSRRFRDDVEEVLADPELLQNAGNFKRFAHSPYGYLINFECILDNKNQPVPPYEYIDIALPADWQRIAILTLTESSYTCNSRRILGAEQLRWRHLEIMGYRVVEIPYFEWYSMGLSDYHAKVDYLSAKIFNS